MSEGRLPTHVEVSALIRAVESGGGFATVISKGDREAGVILILTIERGGGARLWERMPRLDGAREFTVACAQDTANMSKFDDYLNRRMSRDADSWVIELDIANPERFIAELGC